MRKILVIDDDPDFLPICHKILETEGYQVLEARDGATALDTLDQEKPDLVLLDVMMSSILQGVDVSKQIKADPNLKGVPVIMVSSITASQYAIAFPDDERLPFEGWISKPIQPNVLSETVRQFIGQASGTRPSR